MSTVLDTPQRAEIAVHAHIAIADIGALSLEHGGRLDDARIAFSCYGSVDAPAVLVLGGISAGRHLLRDSTPRSGWWPRVADTGGALDPRRLRLIGIDYIGGRGDSSSPAHVHAPDRWPVITTRDQASAIAVLLDAIGVDQLHAIVGASYGGMVALAFAEQFPRRARRVIALCAAHRSSAMATAVRSVQRRIVRNAIANGDAERGVAVSRALAITTYRTAAEFDERFTGDARIIDGAARFPVDSYLDHHGRDYADSFPAQSFLALSQSLDLHRVNPTQITSPCSLICFDSDTLVPPSDVQALAAALPAAASVTCIPSRFGHDGFLKEAAAVNEVLTRALNDELRPTVARGHHGDGRCHESATAGAYTTAGAPPPCGDDGVPVTHYAARVSQRENCAAATRAVRAGVASDTQHGAVIPPIQLSTTFTFEEFGAKRAYDYTRSGNPTRDLLASAIAELEHGVAGLITPTGMAAIAVTLQLLRPGDLLLAAHDGYGGTYRLIQALARKQAFDVQFVDLTDPSAAALIRTRSPRMVWVETPSNPLLRITDIAAIASATHEVGALCVADNTFLSPALQIPIDLGADIVVHSTTKYLNGHSDVVGGAIVARDHAIAEELGWWANCTGATGSPFDSYLTLRGLRTLHPRMRSHQENAAAIVDLLYSHNAVAAVHYPGLSAHPGHAIAARQQRGFGAMVSFELVGGETAIRSVVSKLQHFSLAESLGGVESLIAHPATMTHAAMDPEARRRAGISDSLLRLSVGIEDPADLVADLKTALDTSWTA